MVRHRMWICHGGSRGGRRRSQTSHPASQTMTPPSSPFRRPFPYHAFQNFHFRFQSSLIRPIISANISIIFTEEESSTPVSASDIAESSQEGLRIVGSHGLEQQQGNIGQTSKQGGLQATDKGIEGSLSSSPQAVQPGGSIHGASASVEANGSSSSSPQASNPPGGSGEGEPEHGEDISYGNECLVEEVQPDQDKLI